MAALGLRSEFSDVLIRMRYSSNLGVNNAAASGVIAKVSDAYFLTDDLYPQASDVLETRESIIERESWSQ